MRDPLTEAIIAAIRALWDETTHQLPSARIYDYLVEAGQVTPPRSIAPTLASLERTGLIGLTSGILAREGAGLHGGWMITQVKASVLRK